MLNFGASKPRVKGGPGPPGPSLDPRLLNQKTYWLLCLNDKRSEPKALHVRRSNF